MIKNLIYFFLFDNLKLSNECRYVFSFALGVGPVPSLLLPEIFPNRIRAKAMAVCMCVHWVSLVIVLYFLNLRNRGLTKD
jgi:hypothetical protein